MKSLFDVSKASHNLGCWAVCAGESPCNACARNASALHGSPLAPRLCTILCSLRDLAPGKVLIAPLRLLNGHVKQLQTNNP